MKLAEKIRYLREVEGSLRGLERPMTQQELVAAVRKEYPEWSNDLVFQVASAVGTAVFLLLFMGNFGHNLFRFSWLWYGGFLIITRHCVEQRCQVATDGTRIEHGYESILDPSLVRNPI